MNTFPTGTDPLFVAFVTQCLANKKPHPVPKSQLDDANILEALRGEFLFCFDIPPGIQSIIVMANFLTKQCERHERTFNKYGKEIIEDLARKINILNHHFFLWMEKEIQDHSVVADNLRGKNYDYRIVAPWKVVGFELPEIFDVD